MSGEGDAQNGTAPPPKATEALHGRVAVASEGSATGGDGDLVLAALGCLFELWYPGKEADEFHSSLVADVDPEGEDLGDAGTYSEVTLEGGRTLLKAIEEISGEALGESDVFYDLGSGLGRLVLQVFLTSSVGRAGGVELGAARHRTAAAVGRAARAPGPVVYGIGAGEGGGDVFAQVLKSMTPPRPTSTGSEWVRVIAGPVKAIAIDGNIIYAVRSDRRVYKQVLSAASPVEDGWQLASSPAVESIEIHGELDMIYAIGIDRCVWKQSLSAMTHNSTWRLASRSAVVSVAIHSATDMIYGVGVDMAVYKQRLSTMTSQTEWASAAKGSVERIAIWGDTLYGVAYDKRVWTQALGPMSISTEWSVASRDSVRDVALAGMGFHPPSPAEASRGGAAPLEFFHGDALRAVDGLEDASVLHVSSLFFAEGLLLDLAWAMSATLRPGTLVLSQRDLPGCWPGLLHVGDFEVPMSWSGAARVRAFIVTPPPLAPQPAWLVTRGPSTDAALQALRASAVGEGADAMVSSEQWFAAAKRAWPGCDGAVLRRLVAAPRSMLIAGVAVDGAGSSPEGHVPLCLLEAMVLDRVKGSLGVRPVDCAWRALVAAARMVPPPPPVANQSAPAPPPAPPAEKSEAAGTAAAAVADAAEAAAAAAAVAEAAAASARLDAIMLRMAVEGLQELVDAANRSLLVVAAVAAEERAALQVLPGLLDGQAPPVVALSSALEAAIRRGHLEVVRLLLDRRAPPEPSPQGTQRRTPLQIAAARGHLAVAALLLERGASAQLADEEGRLPWTTAALKDVNMTVLLGGPNVIATS